MDLKSDNVVYRGNPLEVGGWFDELVEQGINYESKGNDGESLHNDALRAGDKLQVLVNNSNIGPRKRLRVLENAFKYNSSIKMKMIQLSRAYIGWRPIRGDGNCFYRAIIVGLLEQLILSQDSSGFHSLRELFSVVQEHFTNAVVGPKGLVGRGDGLDALALVCTKLSQAAGKNTWRSVAEFEFEMNSVETALDTSLVMSCRLLTCWFLLTNQDKDMNGLSLREAILSSYTDISDIESYCNKYVAEMGVDAEGPLVSGGLFLGVLRCHGCMVLLDSREEVQLSVLGFTDVQDQSLMATERSQTCDLLESDLLTSKEPQSQPSSQNKKIATVHVMLRPGHYDLLYPRPEVLSMSGGATKAVCKLANIAVGDGECAGQEDDEYVILHDEGSSSDELEGTGDGTFNGELHTPVLTDYMDVGQDEGLGAKVSTLPVRVIVCYLLPTRTMGLEVHGSDRGGGLVVEPHRMTVSARSTADALVDCRRQLNLSESRDLRLVSEDLFLRSLFPGDYARDAVFSASTALVEGATYYLIVKSVVTVWLYLGYRIKLTSRLVNEFDQRWLVTLDLPVVVPMSRSLSISMGEAIVRAIQDFTQLPPQRSVYTGGANAYAYESDKRASAGHGRSQTPVPVRSLSQKAANTPATTTPQLTTKDVSVLSRPRSASVGRSHTQAKYSAERFDVSKTKLETPSETTSSASLTENITNYVNKLTQEWSNRIKQFQEKELHEIADAAYLFMLQSYKMIQGLPVENEWYNNYKLDNIFVQEMTLSSIQQSVDHEMTPSEGSISQVPGSLTLVKPANQQSQDICIQFLKGRCRFGASCRRIHPPETPSKAKAQTPPLSSTQTKGVDHSRKRKAEEELCQA